MRISTDESVFVREYSTYMKNPLLPKSRNPITPPECYSLRPGLDLFPMAGPMEDVVACLVIQVSTARL